jgi:adenine-specific DNA-methyltransferase
VKKVDEAAEILRGLSLPAKQQNLRSALTLLALAHLGKTDLWENTSRPLLRTVDIMAWMSKKYGKKYMPNSRETIRRQTLHQFEQARIVDRNPDDPARPTNSGDNNYQLTEAAAVVLRAYGTTDFDKNCVAFIQAHGSLKEAYNKERNYLKVPVVLPNGLTVTLSPGKHNELQRAIIEQFAPRFAPGAELVCMGDTADKDLVLSAALLAKLNIPPMNHDKLPDVVLYDHEKGWLFLIEAVTSHGPVSPKRHAELEKMLGACPAARVYVTAFLDATSFRKHAGDIAWESEAWLAMNPDHMIHYNGARFLGPYRTV